jgi:alkaline phosphatase D
MDRLTRRSFLTGSLALYGLASAPLRAAAILGQTPRFPSSPFTLGVASGDPTPDGAVLWTRLAIDPVHGGGMPAVPIDVRWEVASDDRLMNIVQQGRTSALPEWAHSVHVEVEGLQSARARCRVTAQSSIGSVLRSCRARTGRWAISRRTATSRRKT